LVDGSRDERKAHRAIAQMVEGKKPGCDLGKHIVHVSGIETIEAKRAHGRPLPWESGQRDWFALFKNLVAEEKWERGERDRAATGARRRAYVELPESTERDEKEGHPSVLRKADSQVKAPVMIDTTIPRRSTALTYCQGKDSQFHQSGRRREKFERVCRSPMSSGQRWSWGALTRTSCRRRHLRGSGSAKIAQSGVQYC